jgi:glycosyltransferase involved in cell wall biosynthesis
MKICHVTSVHPWSDARIYTKMVCGLRQNGINTVLVAPNHPPHKIKVGGVILLPPPKNRLSRILFFRRRVILRALKTNPDIVHLHDPELFGYTRLFKKHGIKVVLDWHEDFVGQIKNKHWIPRMFRGSISFVASIWCRFITKRADASITVTPPIVQTMSFANPLLIRNFPTLREFPEKTNPPTDRVEVVYIGGVSEIRGCYTMAEAIGLVAKQIPLTWVVAGDVSIMVDQDRLRALAYPASINILGRVSRDRVASVLSSATVGLCVIQDVSNYSVSYPTKVFEYMMWGVPVVMTQFDTLADLFGVDVPGIFVDPQNIDEVSSAIALLLNNPAEAQRLGSIGRKLVKNRFNWEVDLSELITLYQSLLIKH